MVAAVPDSVVQLKKLHLTPDSRRFPATLFHYQIQPLSSRQNCTAAHKPSYSHLLEKSTVQAIYYSHTVVQRTQIESRTSRRRTIIFSPNESHPRGPTRSCDLQIHTATRTKAARLVTVSFTRLSAPNSQPFLGGNGQKRELRVLFGQKRIYPENNCGRECCWPYLIGQHPLSPVCGQKRPGTPGNSYFAQLPPVFGHFLFRFWPVFYVPFR